MSDSAEEGVGVVLLDTDVFSRVFVQQTAGDRQQWVDALAGRTLAIAVQTLVELRAWPRLRQWGEPRTRLLAERLAALPSVPVGEAVQASFVDLTVWGKVTGHAISNKVHTADRWIAATALAFGLELASLDGIYEGIPDLKRFAPPAMPSGAASPGDG